ncbi:MAG: hypothetical protein ACXACX_03450 [Candidatus Hodarchaeales archaeon]|jgi:hypothetical protein
MQTIESNVDLFERYFVSIAAIVCALGLAILSLSGPLLLNIIEYKSSQSAIIQAQAQDFVNLILIAPISFIGGLLLIRNNENAKYFLILVPMYSIFYTGLAYAIFPEWSHSTYTGNSEQFFYLYWIIIVSGMIILLKSLSLFSPEDAPDFNKRNLKIYIGFMSFFLSLFVLMWISEIQEVLLTGDSASGYSESPTIFWVIKTIDLGITLPLGIISLYLLWTRTKQAYPIILLFFGYFVSIGTAVFVMAILMLINNDPSLQEGSLFIFPILMLLAWIGFFYLIKHKLTFIFK